MFRYFASFSGFARGKISDYLRKLDTDDAVIMDVFGLSKKICTCHTRVEDFMVFKKFGLVIFNMNLNQDI